MAKTEDTVRIVLKGCINSNNAGQVEKDIFSQLAGKKDVSVIIDASGLEVISSAGLRVILHVKKDYPDLRIVGVSLNIYEILEMTGFTEMMPVEKGYQTISIEGCEEIAHGANGTVYRIDQDTVVKVYNDLDSLDDIQHEREMARLALILGIPTAISYDVVKVGDRYGSVFELLNARSFSKLLASGEKDMEWCVREYVEMLKKIHGTVAPEGKLPKIKDRAFSWVRFVQDHLPETAGKKLIELVEAVPEDRHMIHGDYHTMNLELQNDEVLIIDMDTLAEGHPVFELASMFNAYTGYAEMDHDLIRRFQGYDWETGQIFWHKALALYLGTEDEKVLREVEDKARILGYARMIRRSIRRGGLETETRRAEIGHWKGELIELLEKTDTLVF